MAATVCATNLASGAHLDLNSPVSPTVGSSVAVPAVCLPALQGNVSLCQSQTEEATPLGIDAEKQQRLHASPSIAKRKERDRGLGWLHVRGSRACR